MGASFDLAQDALSESNGRKAARRDHVCGLSTHGLASDRTRAGFETVVDTKAGMHRPRGA